MRGTLLLSAFIAICTMSPAWAGTPVAVFPFGLIDDSQEGEADGVRADQTARLKIVTDELRRLLAEEGTYTPVDLSSIDAEIVKALPIDKCNGCEDALTKKVGAKVAIVATVQKVSNLILNLNLYVRDVEHSKITKAASIDIRGNTDESWLRGVRYLVKNRLFADIPK